MPFFPRAASAYAEYVAAPSRQLARKPAGLSRAEAAALPLAGLTAWQALVDTAQVAVGQRVLIHGAGGGVGHLPVQIAKARGAHVLGTASAAKHDFVAGLGADELIDYRATDFAAHAGGMDVVLDTVGGATARRSIGVLRPGGLLVTIVGRRDVGLATRTEAAGRRFAGVSVEPDYPALEALADLAESGKPARAPADGPGPGRGRQGPRAPRIRQCHRQDRAHGVTQHRSGGAMEAGMAKVAVVTGASQGLGLALVRGLCRRLGAGGIVYLTARDRGRGERAAAGLEAEGLSPRLEMLDVRDDTSVTALAQALGERHGGVDIVVSNAAARIFPQVPADQQVPPSLTPITTAPSG
jgi:hypothetical protein